MHTQPTESQERQNFRSAVANAIVGILFGAAIGAFSGSFVAFVGGWISMPILQMLHLLSSDPASENSGILFPFVLALVIGFTSAPAGAITGLVIALSSKQTKSIAVALVIGVIQATFLTSFSSPWSEKAFILYLSFTIIINRIVAFGISKLLKQT